MSTNSTIARANPDGSYDAIYCHWDGYPDHVGRILSIYYKYPAKVDQLIALGNLSSLGVQIDPPQTSFDNRNPGVCCAYGRDRGESDTAATHYPNRIALIATSEYYIYVYELDRQWSLLVDGVLTSLQKALDDGLSQPYSD